MVGDGKLIRISAGHRLESIVFWCPPLILIYCNLHSKLTQSLFISPIPKATSQKPGGLSKAPKIAAISQSSHIHTVA